MAKTNMWAWLAVGVIVLIVMGVIPNPLTALGGMFSTKTTVDNLYPSNLKTTVTLNTADILATSATSANVSYYVFTSSGYYLKEGSTLAGTASFDVPSGGNYKVVLTKDGGTIDYIPKVIEFSTDGDDPTGRSVKTVNVGLERESGALIDAVQDPIDLDDKASATLGGTTKFNVLVSANVSNAVLNKPIIAFYANTSTIDEVNIVGTTSVTCPERLIPNKGFRYYCFGTGKSIYSSDGITVFSGTVLIDAINEPVGVDTANDTIYVLDTGIYLEPDYKTAGFSSFKYGAENPNTDADIGAGDSAGKALHLT